MNNQVQHYKIKELLLFALGWEIVFWILMSFLLYVFGYFGHQTTSYLSFENPEYFKFIPATLLITLIFIISIYHRNRVYYNTGPFAHQTIFMPAKNSGIFIKYFLFKNTITFLLIALAQPAMGIKSYSTIAENTQIILAMDVSNSMNVRDINQESRLTVAKRAASAFTNQLKGESMGIILFAENAVEHLPITTDYFAARMYISEIETTQLTNQGTSINNLLNKIVNTLKPIKGVSSKLIILTDGEFHDKLDVNIISQMAKNDIQVALVGFGSETGGFVPIDGQNKDLGFKTRADGTTVISKLTKSEFARTAKQLNGFSFIFDTSYPNLGKVFKQLVEIQVSEASNEIFIAKSQKYHIPIIIAILSFLTSLFWNNHILYRLYKIFNSK